MIKTKLFESNNKINTEKNILEYIPSQNITYRTHNGTYIIGDSIKLLNSEEFKILKGKVNLIVTSPPYPLNNKKSYGNLTGEQYLKWFISLAPTFAQMLTDDGSIVLELGNAWEPGRPVQSLLHLKALLGFAEHPDAGLRLIQQFICYNPSRLPSPAHWVTINRIRTVDSYTHVWWFAKKDFPKADNSRVLRPYSKSMLNLLAKGKYNSGIRPSQHTISETSFLTDHGGSIAHNFFEMEQLDSEREVRLPNVFSMANSNSTDFYMRECKKEKIKPHPARMPIGLASFFIEFLSENNNLVLDPFAGSNTTGFASACLKRKWISIEIQKDYAKQSLLRFKDPCLTKEH